MNPVIIEKNGAYCVYLPEWNISGEGKTLEEAHRNFETQKRAVEERGQKFGLATMAPDSYPAMRHRGIFRELGLFFAKVATATFAVILVGILLLPHITAAVKSQINPVPEGAFKRLAVEIPAKLNAKFDNLSPEEQKELIQQWGKLWKRTAPFREIFK